MILRLLYPCVSKNLGSLSLVKPYYPVYCERAHGSATLSSSSSIKAWDVCVCAYAVEIKVQKERKDSGGEENKIECVHFSGAKKK